MQVVLTGLRLELPGRTTELGFPVVRLIAPDIEVAVRVIETAAGLLEPLVFDGGVIDHDVEHQLDTAFASLGDQQLAVSHGPVARVDGVVIADVIAVIALRRTQKWRYP
ncbi:hypothetical protein D3C78_1507230 [compost metagenome]